MLDPLCQLQSFWFVNATQKPGIVTSKYAIWIQSADPVLFHLMIAEQMPRHLNLRQSVGCLLTATCQQLDFRRYCCGQRWLYDFKASAMAHTAVSVCEAYHLTSGCSVCDEVNLVLKDIVILLSRPSLVFGARLGHSSPDLITLPVFLLFPRC